MTKLQHRRRAAAAASSLLGLALVVGCASTSSYGAPTQHAQPDEAAHCAELATLPDCEARLEELDDERRMQALDTVQVETLDTHELSARDCTNAADLRDRICSLATAICQLAKQNPKAEIEPKCTAATTSCNKAQQAVKTTCQN